MLISEFGPFTSILIVTLLTGIFSSFIAEAIDRLNPFKKKLKAKDAKKIKLVKQAWYGLAIVTAIATFIVLMAFRGLFDLNPDPNVFQYDYWDVVLAACFNYVFSIVFYHIGGRKVVKFIVTKVGIKAIEDRTVIHD